MKNKNLKIIVTLDRSYHGNDLQLRHTLVDTLEERGIGEVWDEGMGDGYMEVNVELVSKEDKTNEVKSILQSLGLSQSKLLIEDIE